MQTSPLNKFGVPRYLATETEKKILKNFVKSLDNKHIKCYTIITERDKALNRDRFDLPQGNESASREIVAT